MMELCHLADSYLFKVNNGNTTEMWEISFNLTKNAPEAINAGLRYLLLTLNRFHTLVRRCHC